MVFMGPPCWISTTAAYLVTYSESTATVNGTHWAAVAGPKTCRETLHPPTCAEYIAAPQGRKLSRVVDHSLAKNHAAICTNCSIPCFTGQSHLRACGRCCGSPTSIVHRCPATPLIINAPNWSTFSWKVASVVEATEPPGVGACDCILVCAK